MSSNVTNCVIKIRKIRKRKLAKSYFRLYFVAILLSFYRPPLPLAFHISPRHKHPGQRAASNNNIFAKSFLLTVICGNGGGQNYAKLMHYISTPNFATVNRSFEKI